MRTESFLTKQQRASARKIAARNWNRINEQLPAFGNTFKKNEARRLIRFDIEQEVRSKKRFGSIFTSILISLMLRLAMKWVEKTECDLDQLLEVKAFFETELKASRRLH